MNKDKLIEAMARAMWDQRWKDLQSSPIREFMGANTREWECKEPDVQEAFRQQARAALAALQREQWAPVSERLPEKEQYPVLVAHQSGAVRMVFGIEPFIDGDWMGYYEPALQGRFLRGITHWMPLPPAPQPEEAL